jgi:heme-degrading monooxygenase HmoA
VASTRVHVIVFLRAPDGDRSVIERTYRQISWAREEIAGLLRSELLSDTEDPDGFALLSEWESLAAFREWQLGPDHRDNPSALRPYQDRSRGKHYMVYEVSSGA